MHEYYHRVEMKESRWDRVWNPRQDLWPNQDPNVGARAESEKGAPMLKEKQGRVENFKYNTESKMITPSRKRSGGESRSKEPINIVNQVSAID